MRSRSLASDVLEWAESDSNDFDSNLLDPGSPHTIRAFCEALARPRAIEVVERVEMLTKSLWADVLHGGAFDEQAAHDCGAFFSQLGFFFKYKPYGVKIASPFGYSVFDLKDGEGFSFQLHIEPKLEGFHILRAKNRSLIYISSRDEWNDSGADWAKAAMTGAPIDDVPFTWRPENGDTVEVAQTEVVHAVLGCVLEEYASCSVDAVERLFDQNARSQFLLPDRHPDIVELLSGSRGGQPRRRLERVPGGWTAASVGLGEPIIAVDGELWGGRLGLDVDSRKSISPSDGYLTLIVAVDDMLDVFVNGTQRRVPRGRFACVLPGLEASVAASRAGCSAAVHRVSTALIQADWTR